MRIYQPTYKDKQTGKNRRQKKYWVEFRDHTGTKRRLPAYSHKPDAEGFARHLEGLVRCRRAGDRPDALLLEWLETLPIPSLEKLSRWGLIAPGRTALAHALDNHQGDFEQSLKTKDRTAKHIRETMSAIKEICNECGFTHWRDITASRVDYYLGERREDRVEIVDDKEKVTRGISARTYNYKLKAFKQFCTWMVKEGRATESPVTHLSTLNTKTDRRRVRRPLTQGDAIRLLSTTTQAKERYGMTGPERALLYRVAIETGLRAGELRELTAKSIDKGKNAVLLPAGDSKRRRDDLITLKQETIAALLEHARHKTPDAPLFNLPGKDRMIDMLKADLKDAKIPYQDDQERYLDFHGFRHTTGTWLAQSGVHPRVAQDIMRHSDINLTMNTYTHVLLEQHTEAVNRLPDLSALPMDVSNMATGTEGRDISDLLQNLLRLGNFGRISANSDGQTSENVDSQETWVTGQKGEKRESWGTGIRTPTN